MGSSLIVIERIANWELEKQQWAKAILTRWNNAIKFASDRFHQNFQVGLQAHPLGYIGLNLGCMTKVHKQAK